MMVARRVMLFMLSVLLCAAPAVAQRVRISGTVTDENGDPVELATVNDSRFENSAVTNLRGHYEILLNRRDTIELVFRMVGHEVRRRTLSNPRDSVRLDVMLPTIGYALQGVTVTDMRRQTNQNQTIDMQGIRLQPDASGGSIESLIATQAGVSSHNELSSQYNVRGGNFDENSVYVNGIEVLRPLLVRAGQQEGLSFVNPDMTESIEFSTGGFEARYGDKMSSVLDITYRKPRKTAASVSASLLGGSIWAGTGNEKFSASAAIRYKTNRYLLGTLDTGGEYNPSFLDGQMYLTWAPAKNWELGFIGNVASNSYRFTPTDRRTTFGTLETAKEFKVYFDGWEKDLFNTAFGALELSHSIDEGSSVSLSASVFSSKEKETYDILGQYWLDDVDATLLYSVGSYMEHARNSLNTTVANVQIRGDHAVGPHRLRWGALMQREKISDRMREWELRDSAGYSIPHSETGPLQMIYSLASVSEMESSRFSAYLQDSWRHNGNAGLLTVNAGIRTSYWNWNNELITSPRVSVSFIPAANDMLTFRLATGVYYQAPFYKELKDTVQRNGIATVTLNRNIKSQRSIQIVAGCDYHFHMFDRMFRFTAEAYYKKLDNLIPYNLDNVRIVYYGRNCAHGYAAGIDTKLFGEFVPGTDSWITFSLMRTEECINSKWLPRPSDQMYNLSLYFTDYFPGTDKWRMTLKGCLSDGLPTGPSHTGREQAVFRAPAYKRVDIGMSYRLFKNAWLGIDCFNLFGINNVNSYYWVTDVYDAQYAVPNYLTGRQLNLRFLIDL